MSFLQDFIVVIKVEAKALWLNLNTIQKDNKQQEIGHSINNGFGL